MSPLALAEAVKAQLGSETEKVAAAKERAQRELERIAGIINNPLDNITPTNRKFVDQRLKELTQQRQQLEARREELGRLAASKAEIDAIVNDAMQFLAKLEFTLTEGLPQEKLVALRQCLQQIRVNSPAERTKLVVRLVPAGNLQTTEELSSKVCPVT